MISLRPDAVLVLGDLQYEDGAAWKWALSYEPSWGRFKAISNPTPGGGHDDYGKGDYYAYWGTQAGPTIDQTWYGFDLGNWRIYSLNLNCSRVGGCGPGAPQYEWLKADLAANDKPCQIAFWRNIQRFWRQCLPLGNPPGVAHH